MMAPWQLFFQQSNVIDKRITPRRISYDTATLPDEELLSLALDVVKGVVGRGAAERFREYTYEFARGKFTEVDSPAWWISAAVAR